MCACKHSILCILNVCLQTLYTLYSILCTLSLQTLYMFIMYIMRVLVGLLPLTTFGFAFFFSTHGVTSIYVIVDVFLTGIPVRLLHFYQPLLLCGIYAAFTGVYWAAGNSDPIYPFLDYTNQPSISAIWCCALLASIVAAHCLMFGLYRLRLFVYGSCAPERGQSTPHEVGSGDNSVTDIIIGGKTSG